MDRHTVAGTEAFAESTEDMYLENNCVDDPVKLCDFQLLENRIMKTVDSVYQVIDINLYTLNLKHLVLNKNATYCNQLFFISNIRSINEMQKIV